MNELQPFLFSLLTVSFLHCLFHPLIFFPLSCNHRVVSIFPKLVTIFLQAPLFTLIFDKEK